MELKDIIEIQKEFQKNFMNIDTMSDDERKKWVEKFSLEAIKELCEMLSQLKTKIHRNEDKSFNEYNVITEYVDFFKYVLNIAVVLKIDDKIEEVFKDKTSIVNARYNFEIKMNNFKDCKDVVIFDIDDVLCEYSDFFVQTFNNHFETTYDSIDDIKKGRYFDYVKYKDGYRQSGIKRVIPVVENAVQVLNELKKRGNTIILISSRPYNQYNRIFIDTMYWLEKNGLVYDALYFDEDKRKKIMHMFPNVKFVVEDNLNYANEIASHCIKVYLRNTKYNQGNIAQSVHRIDDLLEVLENG